MRRSIAELLARLGVTDDDLNDGTKSIADSFDRNLGKITAAGVIAGESMRRFGLCPTCGSGARPDPPRRTG